MGYEDSIWIGKYLEQFLSELANVYSTLRGYSITSRAEIYVNKFDATSIQFIEKFETQSMDKLVIYNRSSPGWKKYSLSNLLLTESAFHFRNLLEEDDPDLILEAISEVRPYAYKDMGAAVDQSLQYFAIKTNSILGKRILATYFHKGLTKEQVLWGCKCSVLQIVAEYVYS